MHTQNLQSLENVSFTELLQNAANTYFNYKQQEQALELQKQQLEAERLRAKRRAEEQAALVRQLELQKQLTAARPSSITQQSTQDIEKYLPWAIGAGLLFVYLNSRG